MSALEKQAPLAAIEISWDLADDPRQTIYFVNGSPVGQGDGGFDRILELIRLNKAAQVTLRITRLSLGGGDIKSSTPFADRFNELEEALGERKMALEFF
jgi:hypothetical protein